MTKDKLKLFQDTYAEAMAKYGLKRGIDGSQARHISTPQYYRDLVVKTEDLKEDIEILLENKEDVNDKIRDLYDRKDEAREKFLNMHEYVQQKETEISNLENRFEQLKQEYKPYKTQEDMNLLLEVFPNLSERLRIAQLCKGVGLTIETIKQLFNGESVPYTGKLHSPEHNQDFDVQDAKLQLFKESKDSDRLKLTINGKNILKWFKQKWQEAKQFARPHIKPPKMDEVNQSKGIRR